jgi:hypothetical protein
MKERFHLEDLGVDGRIILKWVFKKWDGGMDWIDLAQEGQVVGSLEWSDGPLGSINCRKLLD